MSSPEFSIIEEFFASRAGGPNESLVLGIGDDCAVIDVPSHKQIAVSTDTLVENVHFLANSEPELLGHKVLAVNLSDLAAMGASPAWASLAITLPAIDKAWLASFAKGFFELAERYSLQLIGGDTTRGPLSITVNVMGLLPKQQRLMRSGANVGDDVYVSGHIGSAGLGLEKARQGYLNMMDAELCSYLKPNPQVALGRELLNVATSCIDVSDGLSADLSHLLKASGVGASVWDECLPVTESVRQHASKLSDDLWPYSTGDDYELCFTLPSNLNADELSKLHKYDITKIGVIEKEGGLRVEVKNGKIFTLNKGYDHFAS
ncbi:MULTISPECIES: thiamine-phosphate kinase [Cycloclasticus]|uniref:Thiamine-monophosphate kinase n=1 Tax=Cycloclasticus pugetii TaxID=34068 RepID=A0AB33Z3G6_9GAMM|nr:MULTISPECIES: thiamine-phosphate kinase [Cycloclasticus]ATI02838.1 thiamine-phosphate kinase [Cycloclasticus sp. PY97N]EPD13583.1 Thiamine-monophosphate kinase [Cycloclasticus pugetii]